MCCGLGKWVGVWIEYVAGGGGWPYAVDRTSRRLFGGGFVFEKMVGGWGWSMGERQKENEGEEGGEGTKEREIFIFLID